jgi:hypothetical protein
MTGICITSKRKAIEMGRVGIAERNAQTSIDLHPDLATRRSAVASIGIRRAISGVGRARFFRGPSPLVARVAEVVRVVYVVCVTAIAGR